MTRDETIALFLECESKRAVARFAALEQGKSEHEAREIAHEAAKERWNEWAEDMLAKRKAVRNPAQGRSSRLHSSRRVPKRAHGWSAHGWSCC